jgi:tripartite-type tricarboxylate transporter receptor subunit TctC
MTVLSRRSLLSSGLSLGVVAAITGRAGAQGYPARPIQVVVPFAAGGGVDATCRIVFEAMGEAIGKRFIIENRGGSSTIIGTRAVAGAPADGYTVLAAPATMVINPALRNDLPYDWRTDLVPITMIAKLPLVVAAPPQTPVSDLAGLAAVGKKEPITFASGGNGTVAHLAGELFGIRTGAQMLHVPYRGEGPAVADAIGGRLTALFATVPSVASQIAGGTLKAIAVTTKERVSGLPDVKTFVEQGIADYDIAAWVALMAPKGTPPEVATVLGRAAQTVLTSPAVKARLVTVGAEPSFCSPAELTATMERDAQTFAEVVRKAKVVKSE